MKNFLAIVVFSVFWFSTVSSLTCDFPSRLWCSSTEIARACKVEQQCAARISTHSGTRAPKVNFGVYYETLCPDSIEFIASQLSPTFFKIGSIINLELVPYGKAKEKQVQSKWEFTCQHGPDECLGNLIQTCGIHILGNLSEIYPFVDCMEQSGLFPDKSGPMCAKKFGVDYKAILNCVNGPLGNKLEHQMAVKTDKLYPPLTSVPWVTLNGVHTNEIQKEAETDLQRLICDTYTGTKPKACQQDKAVHKSLNN